MPYFCDIEHVRNTSDKRADDGEQWNEYRNVAQHCHSHDDYEVESGEDTDVYKVLRLQPFFLD